MLILIPNNDSASNLKPFENVTEENLINLDDSFVNFLHKNVMNTDFLYLK